MFKSTLLPKIVGILLMIGCFGYLLDAFIFFIPPRLRIFFCGDHGCRRIGDGVLAALHGRERREMVAKAARRARLTETIQRPKIPTRQFSLLIFNVLHLR